LKPLNRTTEDAIYTISHSKLATTYRPMIQQVFITSIMRQYISKYQDSPFIIPFKKARPPKKRRLSQLLYQGNNQGNNIRPPLPLPSPTSHGKIINRGKGRARRPLPSANNPPLIFGKITEDASHNERPSSTYKKPKLVDVDDSNLDELLDRGIDFDDNDTISKKSPKGRSKRKGKKKKSNAIYKNIKNSISVDRIDYIEKSSKKVKKKKSSASMNNTNDYDDEYDRGYFSRGHVRRSSSSSSSSNSSNSSYSSSSSSSSSSSGEDDDVPLAILRNKRTSIITI